MSLTVPTDRQSRYLEVIERRQPVIINNMDGADEFVEDSSEETTSRLLENSFGYARSWLGVPLMVKDRTIGVLRVDHTQLNHFTEQDAQLVLAFANQAAVAIENARLYERAQNLAVLEERQRLARELHDSVSQALYGIALGTRTARGLIDRGDNQIEDLAAPLDYVLTLADAGLVEMRSLIFELRPESLEVEGLIAALHKQADALQARNQIEVQTEILCDEPEIPLNKKESLYRVAQEALHNTTKHAHASKVSLRLSQENSHLDLEIADDGIGFDPQKEYPGHLGLKSMRERIEKLGGELIIDSAPKQGTRVRASIPV